MHQTRIKLDSIPLVYSLFFYYVGGYYGDGLLTVGGGESLEKGKQILSQFETGAQDVGKDTESMPKAIELSVEYGIDLEASIENLMKFWAGAFRGP